ncbi:MAG: response regulator [Sphingomonas sp.]|uniref:response regulator n=1 Tax=Sphingomonas sp. TaxID=28214 RepID=UPI00356548E1
MIDDSLTVRAIIEQILESEPDLNVIASASDIPSARAMIAQHFPNVITLDLAMPGIDGMAFLDELAGGPHAPVLVVSSHTKPGSDAESDALALGAAGCFDKAKLVGAGRKFASSLRKAARRTLPVPKPRVPCDLATEPPPSA